MLVNLLMLAILFACLALTTGAGMWGNFLMLVNVVTAGLLAMNYFEPLARWLDAQQPSFTYFNDFLSLWVVFCASLVVLRTLTDTLSKVKVRFKKPFDIAGGAIFGLLTAWALMSFALTTLHTAPLARNFLRGDFQPKPDSRMFFGLAPDRRWLAFTQRMSNGLYYRRGPKDNPAANRFDPYGEFILKYAERRHRFEQTPEARVNTR